MKNSSTRILLFTRSSGLFLALELLRVRLGGNLGFRIKHNATNEVVCGGHIVCCNFHSKNSDLSYFVRFGVLADHVHRAEERGSVLRVCFSPAPFCNLQSQRNGAGPFAFMSKPYGARFQRKTKAESLLPGRIFCPPQASGDVGRARLFAGQPLQCADVTAGPCPPLHGCAPWIKNQRNSVQWVKA